MSRATSGLVISDDNSAIRFSSWVISFSIISESRGFLTTLRRLDPSADADGDPCDDRVPDRALPDRPTPAGLPGWGPRGRVSESARFDPSADADADRRDDCFPDCTLPDGRVSATTDRSAPPLPGCDLTASQSCHSF